MHITIKLHAVMHLHKAQSRVNELDVRLLGSKGMTLHVMKGPRFEVINLFESK